MNDEMIEKAALICAGAGEYGELPYNPDAKKGFIAGAQWRINSAWHNASEKYEIRLSSVVVFKNGSAAVYLDLRDVAYDGLWDEVREYAYWKDLFPDRKEDER